MANWLLHGVCTADEIDRALPRMAAKADAQKAGDPACRSLAADPGVNLALAATRALAFEGSGQPNGYTEPLLHSFRRRLKDTVPVAA